MTRSVFNIHVIIKSLNMFVELYGAVIALLYIACVTVQFTVSSLEMPPGNVLCQHSVALELFD